MQIILGIVLIALVDGAQPLIDPKENKPLKVAIEEINRGLLTYERDPEVQEN